MQALLKVAFATTDLRRVDQHFGSARAFAVYGVGPEQSTLVEVLQFGGQLQRGNEDKLQAKLEALQGCAVVYCQAVGSSAIRQLLSLGVQPVRVSEGAPVSDLLESLRDGRRTSEAPSGFVLPDRLA